MCKDFCVAHGYEFMRCEKVWGAIPYCAQCEEDRASEQPNKQVNAETNGETNV